MERRDFLKISAVTGATAALDSCGSPDVQLIRFLPEEELTPGVATWKPSICTLCPAGCGTLVKVMEGDAEVVRNGKLGLMKMGLAKKLEGNPHHPVNRGKLCPRGQASIQITYHPDRIKHPLKRSGPRGSGEYREISWDEAIKALVTQLQGLQSAKQQMNLKFLSRPLRGQRRELVERFVQLFRAGGPTYFEPFDNAVACYANSYGMGLGQLPTYDLARSNYVISFGADFLGAWNSPVAQSFAYSEMRQGRPGRRGKFVQVEPRMSQTGANADEWIPARPGTEGLLALGLTHVMMKENLRPAREAGRPGELIAGWNRGLPDYTPEKVEEKTGVAAAKVTRLAREMATHLPAVAIVGGAPLAQTNGIFAALAVNALNALLGSIEKPGGVFFTPQATRTGRFIALPGPAGSIMAIDDLVPPLLEGSPHAAKVLLLYDANPVFALPPSFRVREALEKVPFIASFGSFIDETSVLADLILPDHSPLESWLDDIPESGSTEAVVSLAPPAMRPLHNTRAMPDILLQVTPQLGGELASRTPNRMPWTSFEEMLRTQYQELSKEKGSLSASSPEAFWQKLQEAGVWSSADVSARPIREFLTAPLAKVEFRPQEMWWRTARSSSQDAALTAPSPARFREPEFDGAASEHPFHFLPYESQTFLDGSLAHLPWLQEMPDPLSTAMWSTWVEINPKTAERLGIKQGDLVEVASQHGKIQAPALVNPGIAPDVIAMPVGQGHENFTRYASGRGANPMSILAPKVVPETGSLAWAATRVRLSRVGDGKLILFAGGMREHPHSRR